MGVRGRDIAEMVKKSDFKLKIKSDSFNTRLFWTCITILGIFAYIGLFMNVIK